MKNKRYRFFTYGINSIFHKWEFLSEKEIENRVSSLRYTHDCFASIQSYNEDQEDKACPIYLDFDNGSAVEDAMHAMHRMKDLFGTFPYVFFSGSKGYHLVLPIEIIHPHCELIVKKIIKHEIQPGASWDETVYKSRTLWRIKDTINTKSGKYKIKINKDLQFKQEDLKIKELLRFVYKYTHELEEAQYQIKSKKNILINERFDNLNLEEIENSLPPCLKHLLINRPPDGMKNYSIFMIAIYLKERGLSLNETYEIVASYGHYNEYELLEYRSTINSVYAREYSIGCGKNSRLRSIMKLFCDSKCKFYFEDN